MRLASSSECSHPDARKLRSDDYLYLQGPGSIDAATQLTTHRATLESVHGWASVFGDSYGHSEKGKELCRVGICSHFIAEDPTQNDDVRFPGSQGIRAFMAQQITPPSSPNYNALLRHRRKLDRSEAEFHRPYH